MENTAYSQPPHDALFAVGRAILFEMDPEKAHDLALALISRAPIRKIIETRYASGANPVTCMNLSFNNRIGLAAGLDKNGDYIDALGAMGFGHLEIGTVTPRPQAGNAKPRVFRLPQYGALINRMGFNNRGVDHLVEKVQKRCWQGTLGINIGKNSTTPLDEANSDFLYCLERVYSHADYITINISSPNTEGLRDLQQGDRLTRLLSDIKAAQSRLATSHERYVPIAVKIAPDMSNEELDTFCTSALQHEIDAIIVGNTTRERGPVSAHLYAKETGGLSGKPLRSLADSKLQAVAERIGNGAVLIGVGGIDCGAAAQYKLELGAHLVQLYSGLIYHGPALVRDCIRCTGGIAE